jgi:hypothetical protein
MIENKRKSDAYTLIHLNFKPVTKISLKKGLASFFQCEGTSMSFTCIKNILFRKLPNGIFSDIAYGSTC